MGVQIPPAGAMDILELAGYKYPGTQAVQFCAVWVTRKRIMEERVLLIIKEFFEDIEEKEPFQMELMDLKLRFKAKLLEIITSYPTEPEIASRGLDYVLEGVERVIREEIEKVNLESEESLLRTMETLKAVGDVLKEFMHEDRVRDKRKLSSTVGFIGNSVEKLATEHKKRFGGIVRRIKKLFSI